MKKAINTFIGIIVGICPIVIAGILGTLIYNELQNVIGILITLVLAVAAIWAGIYIYRSIQRKGFISFMTVVTASPELDNLEPTDNVGTKKNAARVS